VCSRHPCQRPPSRWLPPPGALQRPAYIQAFAPDRG
jgi:hypothetical protein